MAFSAKTMAFLCAFLLLIYCGAGIITSYALPPGYKLTSKKPRYQIIFMGYFVISLTVFFVLSVCLILFELWKRVARMQWRAKVNDGELSLSPLEEQASAKYEPLPWYAGGGFFTKASFQVFVLFMGFLSANYNTFTINFMKEMWETYANLNPSLVSTVTSSLIVGIICGEVVLGHLGDRYLGLNVAFIVTMSLAILGAFLTGLTHSFWTIALHRFVVGIGVGGSYPLCATLSAQIRSHSHEANIRRQQCQTLVVFSSQGFALLLANFVALVSVSSFDDVTLNPHVSWRVCAGIGSFLSLIAVGLFTQIPKQEQAAEEAHETSKILWQNKWKLLGTGGSWFLFDVMFYANSLFSSTVIKEVFGEDTKLTDVFKHSMIISAIPLLGFLVSGAYFWFTEFSVKVLQLFGFLGMSVTYFVLAIYLDYIEKNKPLFLGLYALTFVFANAGPNATTFVIPTLVYEPKVRATCHGLSAAAGKIGAVIGAALMQPLLDSPTWGLTSVFYICGAVGAFGILLTLFFIPNDAMDQEREAANDFSVNSVSDSSREPLIATASARSGTDRL